MKRFIGAVFIIMMTLALCACGSGDTAAEPAAEEAAEVPAEEAVTEETAAGEDEAIDDPAWDELAALGRIETEDGVLYAYVTVPAELVGDGVTQESIDAAAGDTYTSGQVNEDGSVTYKMTKAQHKAMLEGITKGFDEGLRALIDSPEYAYTEIEHNPNYTEFDVHLSTEEVGLAESVAVLVFFTYGGLYSVFSGQEADDVAVNYYAPDGSLITTSRFSDMQG
ncbi:MAG: hypothetical protein IKD93_07595 [Firmicutes bacterium]|nr:hypothetical protein [Bacillota bacterium]